MLGGCLLALAMAGVLAEGDSAAPAKAPAAKVEIQTRNDQRSLGPKKKASLAEKIDQRLANPVSLCVKDCPLQEVLSDFQTMMGLNIVPDTAALREANVALDAPLSLFVENISTRSALNLLLGQLHLAYIIKDEIILVTTEDRARGPLVQRTYLVADLVVPVDMDADFDKKTKPQPTLENTIMGLIRNTIAPESWQQNGGPGSMDYFPLGMALVVRQDQDVQEQIQDLLAALRRLQDLQVAVEVRIVQVAESTLEKLCLDRKADPRKAGKWDEGVFLNDRQVNLFLTAIHGDPRSSITQAPKVTLFNGQTGPIDLTEKTTFVTDLNVTEAAGKLVLKPQKETLTTGWKYKICPVVAADRRSVRVSLDLKRTDVDALWSPETKEIPLSEKMALTRVSTLSLEQSFTVPAGQTALLYVGQKVAPKGAHKKAGHGREVQHFLVLVKPYIIVNDEGEQVFLGQLPPIPRP